MGLILKKLTIVGLRRRRRVEALFDTGSTDSLIRESLAKDLGPLVELPEPRRYEMARGVIRVRFGFIGGVVLSGHTLDTLFRVVDGLSEDLILGADFLQHWHIRLEPKRRRVILDPKAFRLRVGGGRLRL